MVSAEDILIVTPTTLEHEIIKKMMGAPGLKHLVCGAGPALSSMRLALYLRRFRVRLVILAGVAGSYPGQAKPLDIVYAETEVFGDCGRCGDSGISSIDLPGEELPLSFSLCNFFTPELLNKLKNLGIGSGQMVTVSCVSASQRAIERITDRFPDAVCENMEGASAAMVCRHFNIPLVELRGISNRAGDVDVGNWHIKDALLLTGEKINTLLNDLLK